jgi:hypothetical protein
MAEFVSFDPNVEVLGQSMMSVVAGMSASARPLLEKYGLDKLEADKWYKLQPILDFYKEISLGKNAALNLTSTGTKVPEKAIFPAEIDSIQKAFAVLDEAYHTNHRGGEIGHYTATVINSRQIDVLAETPFPCDLDYGIILGLARRFKPVNGILAVYHDTKTTCRKKGSNSCLYHVTW